MSINTYVYLVRRYIQAHGTLASIKRMLHEAKNRLVFNRYFVYSQDLIHNEFKDIPLPEGCQVERFDTNSEVPEILLTKMFEYYPEQLHHDIIKKRFEKGAHLWCLRSPSDYISFLWSIEGRSLKPHDYFPLTAWDLHVDDVFVFPKYRGQQMNSILNCHVLKFYKAAGFRAVHLEIAEWNTPSIRSFEKQGFIRTGIARLRYHRNKCWVTWWR
jgi:ribosomal protein S18 acetylase RimI-like enzyme